MQLSRDTEITKFANSIFCNEDVLSLNISMQNVFIVHRHDCHHDMGKGAENLIGRKTGTRLNAPLDKLIQIAFRAVLHDNENRVSVPEILMELDDSGALEDFQESYLAMGGLLVLSVHII